MSLFSCLDIHVMALIIYEISNDLAMARVVNGVVEEIACYILFCIVDVYEGFSCFWLMKV